MVSCAVLLPGDPASAKPGGASGAVSGVAIQLLDAPVSRRGDPRALIYIVDYLKPGTTITRRVRVANRSPTPQRIQIYAAAAYISGAEFRFADASTPDELSSWIKPSTSAVNLRAQHSVVVTVTIRVPATASAGERYAVIWASTTSATSAQAVTAIQRVGIRVYLDIGPGGEPRSDFAITACTAARTPAGAPQLTITVHNTGGRALDMLGQVSLLSGPGGVRAGPFPIATGVTLAPGETGSVTAELPNALPNGPWQVHASLSSGTVRHTADTTITFPPAGVSSVSSFHSSHHTLRLLVEIAAALAALTIVVLIIRRRRIRTA